MSVLLFWTTEDETGIGEIYNAPTVAGIGASTSPPTPLQSIATMQAYPYQQYSDDADVSAFFSAYNQLAQGYLDWFNQTSLSLYTSPAISGPLLDFTMEGIYGISRPVFSSLSTRFVSGVNASPVNAVAVNGFQFFRSGTATIATDDYYKRVGTWILYVGDGGAFTIPLLRLRVARFLYGVNGADVTLAQAQAVHITVGGLAPPLAPSLSSVAGGSIGARTYGLRLAYLTPEGETLAGPGATLSVASSHLVEVASPVPEVGATHYNVYMNVLPPNKFLSGVNALAVNGSPVNGSNVPPVSLPTRQNGFPIPIGTNWTEPTSGWVYGPALPSADTSNPGTNFIITVPTQDSAILFQQAIEQGLLPIPFSLSVSVILA